MANQRVCLGPHCIVSSETEHMAWAACTGQFLTTWVQIAPEPGHWDTSTVITKERPVENGLCRHVAHSGHGGRSNNKGPDWLTANGGSNSIGEEVIPLVGTDWKYESGENIVFQPYCAGLVTGKQLVTGTHMHTYKHTSLYTVAPPSRHTVGWLYSSYQWDQNCGG